MYSCGRSLKYIQFLTNFWSEKAVRSTRLCTKRCFFAIQGGGVLKEIRPPRRKVREYTPSSRFRVRSEQQEGPRSYVVKLTIRSPKRGFLVCVRQRHSLELAFENLVTAWGYKGTTVRPKWVSVFPYVHTYIRTYVDNCSQSVGIYLISKFNPRTSSSVQVPAKNRQATQFCPSFRLKF